MIFHTCVCHYPRRTSIDFGMIKSKTKAKLWKFECVAAGGTCICPFRAGLFLIVVAAQGIMCTKQRFHKVGWLVVLRINVDLGIFQPYLDLEAGDNQSLKIQVARPVIKPRSSYSASQELNHSATTAPKDFIKKIVWIICVLKIRNITDKKFFNFPICTQTKSEAEVLKYKNKVQSLQMDLDNSEAVQRDFVKLSQSLQIQLEKIRQAENEVRWQHEEDVEECTHCRQSFSVTKRKVSGNTGKYDRERGPLATRRGCGGVYAL